MAVAAKMIAIAALTSVNGSMIVGARSNYALGRDWPIFAFLARWDEGSGSPRVAILVQGGIALALVIFGALLLLLFVGFAIAQGIGQPSVPSGDAAIVEGVPEDVGTVSEEEFRRNLLQQATQGGLKKTPEPGSTKYEELTKAAMGELLDAIWIAAEAEALGVTATDQQVEDKLDQIKEQNFPTAKAFAEFLETSKFTAEDVEKRVKLQLLGEQIQERINGEAPPPSNSEVADYYDAAKASLEHGAPTYRFVRHYLQRRPAAPLTLRQVDPLIRQLTLYRDLIDEKAGDPT